MVFGFVVKPVMLVWGGSFLLLLLLAQILIGMRKIRFKGRTHQKVHKWAAWALLAFSLFHAFMGIVYALRLTIG